MMVNITVEDMTDIEIIETRLDIIDLAVNAMYKTAESMFKASDKGEVTTMLKLLTNIGANCAAIKIYYNKLKSQLELLKELQSNE